MTCSTTFKTILTLIFAGSFIGNGMTQNNIAIEASKLEDQGQFKKAEETLKNAIVSGSFSGEELKRLEFEIDRIARMRQDYSLAKDELFDEVKESVRDVTREEFEKWVKEGWMDGREIDGKMMFFDTGVRNLYFRHPELNARRITPIDPAPKERRLIDTVTAIKAAAAKEGKPYVLPKTFRVSMHATVDANVASAGETIRAWLPIPRAYPFQTGFKLLSASPEPVSIGDAGSPIRSIYFEEKAQADKSTRFNIEYEYTAYGVCFDPKPDKIVPYAANDPAVGEYTREGPHVIFTPEIRALAARIVGAETNPMLKAKKIYDWMSDHMLYSYALEYSTIRNISANCLANGYGDCGQQGLLFITLCRCAGVPARWQSGWNLFPGDTTNHDWTEIYLAPYGWMPVDPYEGNYATRYIRTLTPAQKLEIRDFYFGGLDQYRMAANSDHSQKLVPAKTSFRSDDVDFQRGELECDGRNIYFGKFNYGLRYQEMPAENVP